MIAIIGDRTLAKQLFVCYVHIMQKRPARRAASTSRAQTTRPSGARRASAPPSAARPVNKRSAILAAAARRFARDGFTATSMRDIAADAGLLAGSIYHHFAAKEDILAAAYAEGVDQIVAAVTAAAAAPRDPWIRLEAAAAAHLEQLLASTPYAALLTLDLRQLEPALVRRLAAERDRYERHLSAIVTTLDLPAGTNRRLVRLMLLGALNWSPTWYRTGGASPRRVAETFVRILRDGAKR